MRLKQTLIQNLASQIKLGARNISGILLDAKTRMHVILYYFHILLSC